jgi:carbamoyltransferase
MATVLGLSFFFHDSAAALVRDGRVLAAAAEERFTRRKHTNEFPKRAIEYCLEAGDLASINDLDAIVFYEKPIVKLNRVVETMVAVWPRALPNFVSRLPAFLGSKFNIQRVLERELPGYHGQFLFTEHHASHAASAFYCSPFEEAAILTIDGVGEWETTTIGVGRGREIRLDRAIHFPHSIGLLYSALTSYLGFRVNDAEWKVMGLAPYGEPRFVDSFRKLVELRPDGSFALNMDYFVHHYSSRWTAHHERWQELFGFPHRDPAGELEQHHEDLARSGQAVVEEMILNLAREARRSSGCDSLVIAGGVALNSVANWKIEEQKVFDHVWIQPAAGDDGGAIGAALLVSQRRFQDPPSPELTDVYLGPEFRPEEIEDLLNRKSVSHARCDDDRLVERVADMLVEGKVVGWFQGRMEFGPRALGARSILADPRNPEMKAIINRKIKFREYFRPFAPAVPLEHVHEYFDVAPGTELPFMLKVPQVRPDKRAQIPAVTHEDGTGRVQTVTEAGNPLFYRLLRAFEKRTGVPVLLNTSFNVRGEPVVCSPEDAWNCFQSTGIDSLALGHCLISKNAAAEIDDSAGYQRSDALEARIGEERTDEPDLPATIMAPQAREGAAVQQRVLEFYKELPFNYYSNAVDTAVELSRANRIAAYPPLHRHFERAERPLRVLDVGCGAGWFANSCAHYYGAEVTGIDLNPVVLRQARSVARLMSGCERVRYQAANVFEFEPAETFDVVNSLGVLHHTPDCHGAVRRALKWIAPGGYLHLGLYHLYGRRPFLDHFAELARGGADETQLYREFERLNPEISDTTHLLSWFRDQVLHPHETQHTYTEIEELLRSESFVVEATSINRFKQLPELAELSRMEHDLERASQAALYRKHRYFPGFFVVWARRA